MKRDEETHHLQGVSFQFSKGGKIIRGRKLKKKKKGITRKKNNSYAA